MTLAQLTARRAIIDADYPPRLPLAWRIFITFAVLFGVAVLALEVVQ